MHFSTQELEVHPLWDALHQLEESLDAFDSQGDPLTLEAVFELRGVAKSAYALRNVEPWRFEGTPGAANDPLNTLTNVVRTATASVVAVAADDEASYVAFRAAVAQHVENAARALQLLPSPTVQLDQMADLVRKTRRDATGVIAALASSADDVEAKLEELRSEISAGQAVSAEAVTAVENAVKAVQSTATTKLTEMEEAIASLLTATAGRRDELLESIEASDRDAKRLLGRVAGLTVSANYAKYALWQGAMATAWSVGAVIVAWTGVHSMLNAVEHSATVSQSEAILKTGLSTSILAIAGFMGRKGSGHHKQARDAKRVQLDLDAFEPFIERLEDETKEDLRIATVTKIFARPHADDRTRDAGDSGTWLQGIYKRAVDALLVRAGLPPT